MSKKSKIDELSELVLDEKVVNVLTARLTMILTPIMEQIAKRIVTEIISEVSTSLKQTMVQICSEESARTEGLLNNVNDRLKVLQDENSILCGKLENVEKYSRLTNLVIHGIPPTYQTDMDSALQPPLHKHETYQSLSNAIKQLCSTRLGIDLSDNDISMTHRLRPTKDSPYGPVIINFTTRRRRNEIYYARRLLRSFPPQLQEPAYPKEKIYINEHLTQIASRIFSGARKLVKSKHLSSAWSNGGTIYIKKTLESSEVPQKIETLEALDKYTSANTTG